MSHYDPLRKGPKYSLEPRVSGHELLACAHSVAEKAHKDEKPRVLSECVEVLCKGVAVTHSNSNRVLHRIVNDFIDNDLTLLEADKDGGLWFFPLEPLAIKPRLP
ncbi:hypothetical protein HPB50_000975 [Hyalomma asiaticum]|uniref:Uncharacterized protein n=1 Tax=Hyalomma asiaticum TaxID=266040 RepID=A0ACB7TCE2_HYAAI|nr:hypothetical protein HPB50_000975 [Hyalomma asiaticum]